MNIADPDTLIQRVMLRPSPTGGPARWIYRPHPRVPKDLHGKPVPRGVPPGSRAVYFINGTMYALCEYHTPLLEAAAHTTDIAEVDSAKVAEVQSTCNIVDKMTPNNVWGEIRDIGIRETVNKMVERSGLEHFQVIPAVAALFEVSTRVVQRALGGSLTAGRAKPAAFKQDPRWRYLVGEAQRSKSSAYSRDTVRAAGTSSRYGRFDTEDLLIKHRGERLFPERCPVLGLPLIYDRHSHPKDLRLISIARRDNTKPMGPDNVHLVSRRAYKLLETRSKPETQEEADAVALWRAGLPNPSINTTGR